MRDSDLDNLDDGPSEDEVLSPRVVGSLSDPTPTSRPRRRSPLEETTRPLLVGTALTVVALGVVVALGAALVLVLWMVV